MGSVWIAGSYQSDFARNYAREGLEISDMVAESVAGTLDWAGVAAEDVAAVHTEFGTINSGFGGRPYRYNYAATNEPGWFLFNGLVKHDALTGREERYQFEPGVFCSEVGVAPRVGGTQEDDAYLVTLTVDMNRDLSECVVFRANDMGRGPIAHAQLPERIASGTHSCWAPGELG